MLGEMLQRRAKKRPLNVGQDCNEEDGEFNNEFYYYYYYLFMFPSSTCMYLY